MANTNELKTTIESTISEKILNRPEYKDYQKSHERTVKLIWGGQFEFDLVIEHNEDRSKRIVFCFSTSDYKTLSGKAGAGKLNKIKADILMMLGTEAEKKVLVFTGESMYQKIENEKTIGRLPKDIETLYLELDSNNQEVVSNIKNVASQEVTPSR